jgi:cell wall-associated NlpC family hydrolase
MQVNLGEELQITPDFKNVLAGDLLFFGSEKRISHVAISLGGPQFIHSSGTVHTNSLSENDDNYNEYRKRTLRHIKRVIKD